MRNIFKRAFQDTIKFFGWNRKSITLPIFYASGLYLYWQFKGIGAVRDTIIQFFAFGLIPVGGFAVLLFVWNLIQVPNRIKLDKANEAIRILTEENTRYKATIDLQKVGFFLEPIGSLLLTSGVLQLTITCKAELQPVIVDKLFLEVDGSRIALAEGIIPFKVYPQYTDHWQFDLSNLIKDKSYVGKLIAVVGKKEHESREFKVHR